jgi:hypothetical protein
LPFCKIVLKAKKPASALYPKKLNTLGDHLRRKRLDLKLFQKEVARKGKLLSKSTIYRIFTNPFYCGHFEFPKGSGNWYKGSHERMITQDEYDRVQVFLGRKGNPRPKKYNFAFRGIIRCGGVEQW